MMVNIFVNGKLVGDSDEPLNQLLTDNASEVSPRIFNRTDKPTYSFVSEGKNTVDGHIIFNPTTNEGYVWPNMKPGMGVPMMILTAGLVGMVAFGVGRALAKK